MTTKLCTLAFWLACAARAAGEARVVHESERQIPVAYQVDVVVVGGSTGAVSAAVAAAQAGAKVFLAAPHPYLGDDMTATLRLWLEDGEEPTSPLAWRIFDDKAEKPVVPPARPDPRRLAFKYDADQPSAAIHRDPRSALLTDGQWGNPSKDSVQYDRDVLITADLHSPQEVKDVRVIAYHRAGQKGFHVQSVTVQTSDDKKIWQDVATIKGPETEEELAVLTAPIGTKARYVRFSIKKPADVERILLGEIEICGPAVPDAQAGETPAPQPAAAVRAKSPPPRPMHVKKVLDEALLASGVQFLYNCYPTDVLRDESGKPCGIVMANRAGRQAVVAKTIVDATDRATVARMAGARFSPYPPGTHTFRRVVIGGEPRSAQNMTARIIAPPFQGIFPNKAKTPSGEFAIIEYTLRLPVKDGSYASRAAADQQARDLTYHPQQQFTSDTLLEVPPDAMRGRESANGPWQGVEKLPPGAFQPAEVERLYVLGGCADVSRQQAEKLLRPVALVDLGQRIGSAAAAEAKALPAVDLATVRCAAAVAAVPDRSNTADTAVAQGEVRETLTGVRPVQKLPTILQPARPLPVWGNYDVLVIGGGTSGAPAGIAAARRGAKTLVVETLCGLGGVGTVGAISNYYHGNRVGFSATVGGGNTWVIEEKMEWWRSSLRQAGAEIWFGAVGCGAIVANQKVVGAVIATPQGRGVVLAKVVVDATGNADVAAAAGAPCMYTDASELAMQGTGLPGRKLGATYTNTDFTITDDTDLVDVWHVLVYAKNKYPEAFDQGQLVDTRERRSVVGDFTMTILDQMNQRTYPDTICQARGGKYDTHGYTVEPYLVAVHPSTANLIVDVPYRCLLPKGLDGLLVAGLGMSVHRDAQPLTRMQADMQNQGYAAGTAAAMAAKANSATRNIDIRRLQKHLVDIGNLNPDVLDQQDSYPLPREKLAAAVEGLKKSPEAAAAIFAQPDEGLPLVRAAYSAARGKDRVTYATVLALLGDAAGLDVLVAEVRGTPQWDAGWNYKGMGQYGNALSPLDGLIVALGRTKDRRAVPAILEKLRLLSAKDEFSHHRAAGLALELIGDPAAAAPLAELLAQPGMSGHVHETIAEAIQRETPGGTNAEQTRRESLRELLLARALFRCGDYRGVGKKILESYTHDLRGHLARHAQAVLEAGK